VTCAKDGKLAFWNAKDNYQLISMIKYSKTENELNAVAFIAGKDDASYLIVGGASGALSVFDINGSKVCFTQKSGFTPNEITKLFPLSKKRLFVLNADQQLAEYNLVGKKGAATLEKAKEFCLYLDEIIDVRMLS
jgi:WD40 repeat protein